MTAASENTLGETGLVYALNLACQHICKEAAPITELLTRSWLCTVHNQADNSFKPTSYNCDIRQQENCAATHYQQPVACTAAILLLSSIGRRDLT